MEQSNPLTIKDAIENYLTNGDLPTPVIKQCHDTLNIAVKHFGTDYLLTSITETQVEEFFGSNTANFLPSGATRSNPNKIYIRRMFRQLIEFALINEWISDSPIPAGEAMQGVKPLNIVRKDS